MTEISSAPAIPAPLLAARVDKKRPAVSYHCAACNKNIADEAVPIAVRVAAFVVPEAARDRLGDGTIAFDITDIGLPDIVRELVDANLHADGHVYMGLGCFIAALGVPTFNAFREPAPIVPRAQLDAKGIPNDAFTGREHRDPAAPVREVEYFDRNGVRINADGSPWAPMILPADTPPVAQLVPADPVPADAPAPDPAP